MSLEVNKIKKLKNLRSSFFGKNFILLIFSESFSLRKLFSYEENLKSACALARITYIRIRGIHIRVRGFHRWGRARPRTYARGTYRRAARLVGTCAWHL